MVSTSKMPINLLVVMPIGPMEIELALETLKTSKSYQKKVPYPFLIVINQDQEISEIIDLAQEIFKSIEVFEIEPCPHGDDWPMPQNWCWQKTVKKIQNDSLCDSWFWWEPDAIPVSKNWVTKLLKQFSKCKKDFAGVKVTNQNRTYMSGVGFYPCNTLDYCNNAIRTREHAFDIVASELDLIPYGDISPYITHDHHRRSMEFYVPNDIKDKIPKKCVLFHKCKDGSLGKVLRNQILTAPQPQISFRDQTNWKSGYFSFPTDQARECYFNSSILRYDEKLLLFTRFHRYGQDGEKITEGMGSKLVIWNLTEDLKVKWPPIIPEFISRWPDEQWEDPRAYIGLDGNVYVSMATWIHHKQWNIRQSLVRLSDDLSKVTKIYEPNFGNNNSKPEYAKENEKNWVWFILDGQWYCQYMINPAVIFQTNLSDISKVYNNQHKTVKWKYGTLRGGTPLTKVGDELIGLFHSALMWKEPYRRYYVGAYSLEAKPPFKLKRLTPKPLLIGSEMDFRVLGGPLVLFPNGAILENRTWLVTMGVNDEHSGWIKIPQDQLDERLYPI